MKPTPSRPKSASAPTPPSAKAPLLEIFRSHGRSLFVGFCVAVLWAVAVYVLMIYLPTYVQRAGHVRISAPAKPSARR